MPPQEIRKAQQEKPFMPFRLHVSNGVHYDVLDPTGMVVNMLSIAIGCDPDDESGLFRKTIRVAPNHVTRIEPLPELRRPAPREAGPAT